MLPFLGNNPWYINKIWFVACSLSRLSRGYPRNKKHIQICSLSEVKKNKDFQPSREVSVAFLNLYRFQSWSWLVPLKKGTKACPSLSPAVSEVPSRRCCSLWRTSPWCDTASCGVTVLQSVTLVPLISSGFSSKKSKISPIFWLEKKKKIINLKH